MLDIPQTLNLIAQTIYDKKGMNILGLDIQKVSILTDYVLIAEGYVREHVRALGQAILEALKEAGIQCHYQEGMQDGDWIVLDFLDFMVHLFTPNFRSRYCLEELWKNSEILKLDIRINSLQLDAYSENYRE